VLLRQSTSPMTLGMLQSSRKSLTGCGDTSICSIGCVSWTGGEDVEGGAWKPS